MDSRVCIYILIGNWGLGQEIDRMREREKEKEGEGEEVEKGSEVVLKANKS